MTAIPDDIMAKAEEALQQASAELLRGDAVIAFAIVLAAERERCAKVAEDRANHYTEAERREVGPANAESLLFRAGACQAVADAIREGTAHD